MLIGELAGRTGVTRRALRYYEEQQLLLPERHGNGYRHYHESAVVKVKQIRALLDAGFTSQTVARLLPCAVDTPPVIDLCPDVAAEMNLVLAGINTQLDELARQRESIEGLLSPA
ncbi:putative MerR family transcriptional regulator [Gordonia effusa NBRC 100432]|uniref:Putative MerR family transcriptional regulator n=1 Tax=Gordonia effusa NBRC 100432 TaxID=1077974 RepID=H0QWU1_9ACTN|nr:MerR family transcriptional regulator [Gordonia effusa]GAB17292.1 putative MerR family transcriptional regulator [Gordonia effusa NBRC 100432]